MNQPRRQGGWRTDLLAIDTTTDACSVALAAGGRCLEQTRWAPRQHNRHLLAMIDEVCRAAADGEESARIVRERIRFIAFGAGPGSFTGVRIGVAVAQGLAFAIGAKAIPIPSSAIVAETARTAGRRGVCTISRASRPGWRYVASYDLDDEGISCLAFDELQPGGSPTSATSIDGDRLVVHARTVARLALLHADQAVPPSQALPIYVDGDTPWRPSSTAAG